MSRTTVRITGILLSFFTIISTQNVTAQCTPTVSLSTTGYCVGASLSVRSNLGPCQIQWKLNGSVVQTNTASWASTGTTMAGTTGTTGTGSALLNNPGHIYVDAHDTLYIADETNNRVQKWAPGAVSGVTVAGQASGGAGNDASHLHGPGAVWVDASGNVYVSDVANFRIQKWARGASSGTTVAGTGVFGTSASQLSNPAGICMDASGRLYVADGGNNRIQRFPAGSTSGTSATTVAGSSSGTSGSSATLLSNPSSVFVDASGNLYVSDIANYRVQKFPLGSLTGTTVAGTTGSSGSGLSQFGFPQQVFVDGSGNIYVADLNNNRVMRWAPGASSGTVVGPTGGFGSGSANLNFPYGVWVDTAANLLVSDFNNQRVQKYALNSSAYTTTGNGVYTATVTSFGGCSATTNSITVNPNPIVSLSGSTSCINSLLTVAVNDTPDVIKWQLAGSTVQTNGAVWQINATTAAGSSAGTSGSTSALLNYTTSIYVDANDTVYVGDASNSRVQKWAPGASVGVTVAGGHGNGSAANQLSNVRLGVYVDKTGNVYVADASNNRVQKWARGAITGVTVAGGTGSGYAPNQLSTPTTVYVDDTGNMYVCELANCVSKWAPGSTTKKIVAGPGHGIAGSAANQLSGASAAFVDSNGNVYVADYNNNRIMKFPAGADSTTNGTVVAGGNGLGSAANQLNSPTSVFVDQGGIVYVGDFSNNRVQRWIPGDIAGTTVAGTGAAGSGSNQLNHPYYVWMTPDRSLFVCDNLNNRVQKFSSSSTVNNTYTVPSSGSYAAVVTNFSGCSTTSNSVSINTAPTINVGASPAVCQGITSATQSYTTTNSPTTYSIRWSAAAIAAGFTNVTNATLSGGNITLAIPAAAAGNTYSDTITVTAATGCPNLSPVVSNATVYALPHVAPMSIETTSLCQNYFELTSDSTTGGTWTSGNTPVATVNSIGTIHGVTPGSATITYTTAADAHGCINYTTTPMTILASPATPAAISGTGTGDLCLNATEILTDATGGGTWLSNSPSVATIDSISGLVTPLAVGSTAILYFTAANSNGCKNNTAVIITTRAYPSAPSSITGISSLGSICVNGTITLSDATTGGTWSSSNTSFATVGSSSGVLSGVSAGSLNITYTTAANSFGCTNKTTTPITVNANPIVSLSGSTSCINSLLTVAVNDTPDIIKWQLAGSTVQTNGAVWQTNATTVAGSSSGTAGSTSALLNFPTGIYVDARDTVYVADLNNYRVQKWAPGASAGVTVAGGNGSGSAANQLGGVRYGIYVDKSGNVYVADYMNHRIQKWARGASAGTTVAGGNGSGYASNQLSFPTSVYVDDTGSIYVSESGGNCISKWSVGPATKKIVAGTGHGIAGSAANQLDFPQMAVLDVSGNIYVADYHNFRVLKFPVGSDSTTNGTVVAGGNGLGSAANQLNSPIATFVDPNGVVYVCDDGNYRIQRWMPGASAGTTVAGITGSTGTGANQLGLTLGVWMNPNGNLYVCDRDNNRVQKFSPSSSLNNTYTVPVNGSYTAIVTSNYGCSTTSNAVSINPAPSISFGASPAVCQGVTSALQSYTSANSPTTYSIRWSPAAITAGFTNVINASLPVGNITLAIPVAAAGNTYPDTITVAAATGCPSLSPVLSNTIVYALPSIAAITGTGTGNLCSNATDTLNDATTGGAWSSNNTASATVGSSSGVVSGVAAGTTTITYTTAPDTHGCISYTTSGLNVIAAPVVAAITGLPLVGIGDAITLTDATGGGSWTSNNSSVATAGSGTGLISGISNGTVSISYAVTNGSGCKTIVNKSVNVLSSNNWTGTTSTDWNTGTNWSGGGIPTAYIDAVIPSGVAHYPDITSGSYQAKKVQVASGASITLEAGTSITAKDTVTNNGHIYGDGSLILSNNSAQVLAGKGSYSNLVLSNFSGVSISGGSKVTIGNSLAMTAGTLITNDSLVLGSDSSATARIAPLPSGTSIIGNVQIRKYIQGGRRAFRFWGHPFTTDIALDQIQKYIDITGTGGYTNGFTWTVTDAPSSFRYNPLAGNSTMGYDPGWRPFTSTHGTPDSNLFHRYQGIRLFIRGAKGLGLNGYPYIPAPVTIGMSGPVNQGNLTIVLTKGVDSTQDYNQVANPYPSPVDIGTVAYNAWHSGNVVGSAIYIWNPYLGVNGQFQAVPITGGVPYSLEAYTSFQIRAAHNGDTLNFTESNKTNSYATTILRQAKDGVTLSVYDAVYHPWDKLEVTFNDDATDAEDNSYDALKPSGPAGLNFYSLSLDNKKMAIDGRTYQQGKIIPLGINSSYAQEFIIKVDELSVPTGRKVYFRDKLKNQCLQLSQGTEYHFEITNEKNTQGNERFELSLGDSDATTTISNELSNVEISPNPASETLTLSYEFSDKTAKKVRVIDMLGACVFSKDLGNTERGNAKLEVSTLAEGIYILEVESGDKLIKQRFVKE